MMKNLSLGLLLILFVSASFLMTSCNDKEVSCGECKFETLPDSIWDVENNAYSQVKIGNQIWLGENLRSVHYADGSIIDNTDNDLGARCYNPNNQPDNANLYGKLYNWAAARHLADSVVKEGKLQGICPEHFHLPSDEEWSELVYFAQHCSNNESRLSAAKMLAAADSSWRSSDSKNTPGYDLKTNNVLHFGALPAGNCYAGDDMTPKFYCFHTMANFWSSTAYGDTNNPHAYGRAIEYDDVVANKSVSNKKACFSVRCIKD